MKQAMDRPAETEQARMEAVWRQRAARLALRSEPAGQAQETIPVLVLAIGEERYGIDLAEVAEVLPAVEVTPVPGAPAVLSGVVNVRGEIRPVLDLRRKLGLPTAGTGSGRVVLLRKRGREFGLRADGVEHIRRIAAGELQSAAGSGLKLSAIQGLTADLLMLLRTDELVEELCKGTTI